MALARSSAVDVKESSDPALLLRVLGGEDSRWRSLCFRNLCLFPQADLPVDSATATSFSSPRRQFTCSLLFDVYIALLRAD